MSTCPMPQGLKPFLSVVQNAGLKACSTQRPAPPKGLKSGATQKAQILSPKGLKACSTPGLKSGSLQRPEGQLAPKV